MTDIEVRSDRGPAQGWSCTVTIREGHREVSAHRVRVSTDDLTRLAAGAADPSALVEQSFGFLLEREPPHMILRTFDLPEIGRYFPDFEPEIRRRMLGLSSAEASPGQAGTATPT